MAGELSGQQGDVLKAVGAGKGKFRQADVLKAVAPKLRALEEKVRATNVGFYLSTSKKQGYVKFGK
jgi:hypothetical protein